MISEERAFEVEENLAVWDLGFLQDFCTLKRHLDEVEITFEEIEATIERRKMIHRANMIASAEFSEKVAEAKYQRFPKCACGETMLLEPVNDHPARMVGGDYKTWWVCPDLMCDLKDPILNKEDVPEIMVKLRIPYQPLLRPRPTMKPRSGLPVRSADCMKKKEKKRVI